MGKVKVNMMIVFLMGMQVEKVTVLGEDEAKDDVEQIQKVISTYSQNIWNYLDELLLSVITMILGMIRR